MVMPSLPACSDLHSWEKYANMFFSLGGCIRLDEAQIALLYAPELGRCHADRSALLKWKAMITKRLECNLCVYNKREYSAEQCAIDEFTILCLTRGIGEFTDTIPAVLAGLNAGEVQDAVAKLALVQCDGREDPGGEDYCILQFSAAQWRCHPAAKLSIEAFATQCAEGGQDLGNPRYCSDVDLRPQPPLRLMLSRFVAYARSPRTELLNRWDRTRWSLFRRATDLENAAWHFACLQTTLASSSGDSLAAASSLQMTPSAWEREGRATHCSKRFCVLERKQRCACGALYCSKACYEADWPEHKATCKMVRGAIADPAKAAELSAQTSYDDDLGFAVDDHVALTGLKAEELNGQVGVLLGKSNERLGRWRVQLTDGVVKAVRPRNLRMI